VSERVMISDKTYETHEDKRRRRLQRTSETRTYRLELVLWLWLLTANKKCCFL